mgnify:FL=1
MIPHQLKKLVEQQSGSVHRVSRQAVESALNELQVSLDSEFAEFFFTYTITLFRSEESDEQLCDVVAPTSEIVVGSRFIWDVWGVPEHFICLTNLQGEGAYLYDRNAGGVWDFELRSREAFLAGRQQAKWGSFFEFMTWYLGEPG